MATPGWFGKLAMLGDFAHRRLPRVFVDACDGWLSAGVAASRRSLGAAWLDTYLTAPVWCFAWSPGIVDDAWWFGVLMPSVDAVGRYFPLVLAFSTPQAPVEPHALAEWTRWYESASRAALRTLEGQPTLDDFESALAAAETPSASPAPESAGPRPQGQSTWWPLADTEPSPPVTVIRGLPAADRFAGLLQGALE